MRLAVDTSALVAILEDEPEKQQFTDCLSDHEAVIAAGTLVELLGVMRVRRRDIGALWVWRLLELQRVRVIETSVEQVRLADEGMARFGQNRGEPPAVLNFGDLFAYALARQLDVPLLFKGNDFSQTDIRPALLA